MSRVMENIGIGELRSNPVADQCLKCFALYIKSIITLILKIQFQASSNQQPGLFVLYLVKEYHIGFTRSGSIKTINIQNSWNKIFRTNRDEDLTKPLHSDVFVTF